MKKTFFVFLLAFALLRIFSPVLAEDAAPAFSFRNGITWASTPEDVRQSESTEGYEDTEDGWFGISYSDVPVSNFTADALVYLFSGDTLLGTWYGFDLNHRTNEPALSEEDCIYLKNALSSKYGEPITADPARLVRVMSAIDEINEEDICQLSNWVLPDGTYIAQMTFEDVSPYQYILYFNEEALLEAAGIYNTSGL